jgi:hypothetical protein
MYANKWYVLVFAMITGSLLGCMGERIGKGGMQSSGKGHVCVKPDGRYYGIAANETCSPPAREALRRPGTGFLGLNAELAINYDTAKQQAMAKTESAILASRVEEAWSAKKAEDTYWFERFTPGMLSKLITETMSDQEVRAAYYASTDWGGRTRSDGEDNINITNRDRFLGEMTRREEAYNRSPKGKAEAARLDKAREREEAQRAKEKLAELSSASGITNGAVLGVLEDIEGIRNELVTNAIGKGISGPEAAAYVKDQLRPSIETSVRSVGGSSSDVHRAISYVNQGIDANLNP